MALREQPAGVRKDSGTQGSPVQRPDRIRRRVPAGALQVAGLVMLALSVSTPRARAEGACQTYKGYCLSHEAFIFLVCIEQVGGGRLLVEEKKANQGGNDVKLSAAGSGSGLVLKGAGNMEFDRAAITVAGQELRTVYAPQLVDSCMRLSVGPSRSMPAAGHHTSKNVRADDGCGDHAKDDLLIRARIVRIAATQDGEAQSAPWTFDVVIGGRSLSIPRLQYNDKKAPVHIGQEMYIVWRSRDGKIPVSITGTNLDHQWKAVGHGEIPLSAMQGESSIRAQVPDAEQSGDFSVFLQLDVVPKSSAGN